MSKLSKDCHETIISMTKKAFLHNVDFILIKDMRLSSLVHTLKKVPNMSYIWPDSQILIIDEGYKTISCILFFNQSTITDYCFQFSGLHIFWCQVLFFKKPFWSIIPLSFVFLDFFAKSLVITSWNVIAILFSMQKLLFYLIF